METFPTFHSFKCRDWGTKENDVSLLRRVPSNELVEFQARVRPLAAEPAVEIHDRLFRGIRRPFHCQLATGWMANALRTDRGRVRYISIERLGTEFGWEPDKVVFLVYAGDVLIGDWSWVWSCLGTGWIDTFNNLVVCSDDSHWAAVYWEGDGPRCVNRGDRRLCSPVGE